MNPQTEPVVPVIDSRASYAAALQWGFHAAIGQQARRIICADPSLAEWPLDDPALLQALTAWLRLPQRRLVLLAATFDEVPRRCPRFNAWRGSWAHAIEAWAPPAELATQVPSVLCCDGTASVQLIDPVHWRGRCALNERIARQWREDIDALLQRSERAFAVNTLGL